MEMIKLSCLAVGEGSIFSVEAEPTDFVMELRDAIKERKPNLIRCDASALRLYLATTPDGEWLSSTDDDVKALQRREVPAAIQKLMQEEGGTEMDESWKVFEFFGKQFTSEDHHIHALVKIPENPYPQFRTRAHPREDAFCSLSALWSILTPLFSVGQNQEKEKVV